MSELRGLGAVHQELARKGGRLLTVCVDSPQQNADVVTRQRLPFSILSDEQRRVVREFGVLHEKGGPQGQDIAIPAHFLIDREGRIVWRYVATRAQSRPSPQTLLDEIRRRFP
ncbi:MAG: redoxin domain-containing protein [Phycisphaerae bacterium]